MPESKAWIDFMTIQLPVLQNVICEDMKCSKPFYMITSNIFEI